MARNGNWFSKSGGMYSGRLVRKSAQYLSVPIPVEVCLCQQPAAEHRHLAKPPNDVIPLHEHEWLTHPLTHPQPPPSSYNQRTLHTPHPTTIHNPQPTWGLLISTPLPSSTSSYVPLRSTLSPGLIIPISVRPAVIHLSSLTSTQSGVGLARSAFSTDSLAIRRFSLNYPLRRVVHITHYTLLCYTSPRLLDYTILTQFIIRSYPPSLRSSLNKKKTKVLYLPAWTPKHSKM